MVPGNKLNEVHQKALNFLKEKYPNMVEYLGQNLGHGIGLEFRESVLLINEKNSHVIQKNMVFSVGVNFTGM